jgi:hypothetical protein
LSSAFRDEERVAYGDLPSPISKYMATEFHLGLGKPFDDGGRRRAVDYANAQVGVAFDYLGLARVSLQAGGLLMDADPVLTLPADIAKRFDVRP